MRTKKERQAGADLAPESNEKALAVRIAKDLERYPVSLDLVKSLERDYSGLTIAGVSDREGYKVVNEAYLRVRSLRTGIEKVRKVLNEDAIAYKKAVDSKAKELTALVSPLELSLKGKLDEIDAIEERAKQEAREREEQRNEARRSRLFALGMIFDGSNYSLAGSIVSLQEVYSFTEEAYLAFILETEDRVNKYEARRKEEAEIALAAKAKLDEINRKLREAEDKLKSSEEKLKILEPVKEEPVKTATDPTDPARPATFCLDGPIVVDVPEPSPRIVNTNRERLSLAITYLEDGAVSSALEILRSLLETI